MQTSTSVAVMEGPMIRSRSIKVTVIKIRRALAAPERSSSLQENLGLNRASRIPQSPAAIFSPNRKSKGGGYPKKYATPFRRIHSRKVFLVFQCNIDEIIAANGIEKEGNQRNDPQMPGPFIRFDFQ